MKPLDVSYKRIIDRSYWDDNGCLICDCSRDRRGSPQVRWKNASGKWSMRKAVRIVYEFHRLGINEDLVVMHSCDNPSCVNIKHLSQGTQKDNVMDAVRKKRMARGERNGSCKITDEAVESIKSSSATNMFLAELYGISVRHVYYIKSGEYRQ